jgi:hypothetical protein
VGQIVEVPVAERHVIVPDEVLDEVSSPICSGQRHINPLHEPSPRGLVQVLRAVRGAWEMRQRDDEEDKPANGETEKVEVGCGVPITMTRSPGPAEVTPSNRMRNSFFNLRDASCSELLLLCEKRPASVS